jgi:hypothetical protein
MHMNNFEFFFYKHTSAVEGPKGPKLKTTQYYKCVESNMLILHWQYRRHVEEGSNEKHQHAAAVDGSKGPIFEKLNSCECVD